MDSILLFPPGASGLASAWASTIQLGSWLDPEVGVDYGAKGLIRSIQSGNALIDGGAFGYRSAPVRHMAIPLVINTASPAMWEGMLARAAMPGAIVGIQPELVPSSQAVYFDVVDGRYEPDHNIFLNRAGRRKGTLFLETQPYGYWPTEIVLASSASVGWNGQLAVNGASMIGDVSPLAHVIVQPTSASAYMPTGSWYADMLAWSLSGRPSFAPMIPANQFVFMASPPPWGAGGSGFYAASLSGDKYASGSQAWIVTPSTGQIESAQTQTMPWTLLFSSSRGAIPSALEPAYRGRFRVFALGRTTPSDYPWNVIVDAVPAGAQQSLASANQIATWAQPVYPSSLYFVASGWLAGATVGVKIAWATSFSPSPGYQIMDCGEMALPPMGSGFQGPVELRVWAAMGPSGRNAQAPASNMQMWFGGLYMLPVDGPAGILVGGMAYPSVGGWGPTVNIPSDAGLGSVWANYGASPATTIQGQFEMGGIAYTDSFLVTTPGASQALSDVRAQHRGVAPRLGASTNNLSILIGDRRAGLSAQTVQANFEFARVSVSYRPAFQFLFGV